jgi:predicted nucleic acid-binding protein
VSALIDTNVLVYRYDPRFPEKQRVATDLLRAGIENGDVRVPHQAVCEFVAATTRLLPDGSRRTALRGAAAYEMSWWDAHLWAYAEVFGADELVSEDLQHGRMYGSVRVRDPFA